MTPFPCPRELITENQEKIFFSGWAKATRKGEDIFFPLGRPLSPSQEISRQKLTKLCPCQHTGAIFWNYFPAGRSLLLATLAVKRSDQRGGGTNAGSEYHNDSTHILLPKELPVKYWKYRNNNNLDSLYLELLFH